MSKAKVEAIYPLTSMQQSLLVHSLFEEHDQGYLQLRCTLNGALDFMLLEQAWQKTIQLHSALRTSVHWENIEKPVQIIHPQAKMPWVHVDWSGLSEAKQLAKLSEHQQKELSNRMPLSKAPVSQLTLIQLSKETHWLLWSCHHILLDGWSSAIILRDVFTHYDALRNSGSYEPKPVPTYQSYLGWLRQQDQQAAEIFWKKSLDHFTQPALVGSALSDSNGGILFKDHVSVLPAEKTQKLQTFLRTQRTTLNTFILALWGMLLGKISGLEDVVFGLTVSGRSGDFPHIERMAGLFMNVLPVRMSLRPEQTIHNWFSFIQQQQVKARSFEHIGLDQITSWTNWPGHLPLFDSLVVVENYPWDDLYGGGIEVEEFQGAIATTYPVTLIVKPGDQLEIILRYNSKEVESELVSWLGKQLLNLFEGTFANEVNSVGILSALIEEHTIPQAKRPADGHLKSVIDPTSVDSLHDYAAPKTTLELKLTKIWEEVFGQQPIGIKDNFFEIGGKSLLAVRLFSIIERQLGRNLPPSTLLQYPTIELLAQAWDKESSNSSWSSLVTLRASGTKPPLFVIHAGGGHVFFYLPLAKHLDPDQPVYALQPLGLSGEEEKHKSIEKMATHYLEVIRQAHPQGPFAILSYCFSNPVCLEMGIQMEKMGETQCQLIIVDSAPGHLVNKKNTPLEMGVTRFKSRFKSNPLFAIWKMITGGLKNGWRISLEKWNYWSTRYGGDRQARDLLLTQQSLIKLYFQYHWKPFNGKVTFIRSQQKLNRPDSKDVSVWNGLALGGVEVLVAPGSHQTLFEEPDVIGLAQCLQRHLDKSCKQPADNHVVTGS